MEEKKYLKRKEKALSDGNREQLATTCSILGDLYNQQGKYQNAVKEYQQEADIYAKIGKKLEMAKASRMVGEMYMLLSEFDNAKEHINIYLGTVKTLANKVEEQRAYATLGRAYLLHGQSTSTGDGNAATTKANLKNAEKSFLKSLLLIKELSGQISKQEQLDMQARCYLNIGVVKEHMGDFESSVVYIEKAIKISRANDIFELTHLCYISMSLLYSLKKNETTLALRYCNLALEMAKRLPNKVQKICETLITKAEILIREGDFASAKLILTKAYKKNTPDENDRQAIEKSLRVVVKICQLFDELVTTSSVDYAKRKCLYERLGDGSCQLQNYTKALEYYQNMLECAQLNGETGSSLIPIYISLYQTYKDNKEYDKALDYLWKEYDLNVDVPAEAIASLCSIADIYELQGESFWTIHAIYMTAQTCLNKADAGATRKKLERVIYARKYKLQIKNDMLVMAENTLDEAKAKGIDLARLVDDEDSDSESGVEQNTPELGSDVCLDDLTDSDLSDLDETEKPRAHRATRGQRCLTIKRNNKGETQLHQACIAGNLELVRRLLDQGHVVNVRDHAGWIPLHEACNHGHCEIVALLLDRGASAAINDKGGTSCDGITPLYDACSNGYLDVVEVLLDRGADATLKTDFGETCLDGLDKWRRSSALIDGEQAQYAELRERLAQRLVKVGLCTTDTIGKALTNAHVRVAAVSEEDDDDDEDEHEADFRQMRGNRRRSDNNRSADSASNVFKETKRASPRQPAATLEYKHVMQQLKRPNRLQEAPDEDNYSVGTSSGATVAMKQKRAALLNEHDVVDDGNWLVNDMGPEKKKRRYAQPNNSKENLNDSANYSLDNDHLMGMSNENDAFQLLLEAANSQQHRQKQSHKLRLSRSSSISSSGSSGVRLKSRNHQSSLLDSGFCRFRSESPLHSEESSSDAFPAVNALGRSTSETDSTTAPTSTPSIHLVISPSKSSPLKVQATATQMLATTVSFKVKVQDELLLVPIERRKLPDINIRWLAEEAARRYYNLVGLKPVLRLKTADGFAYEEDDSVNVAIEQNMILATVLEWKISPLAQRYAEMCRQTNKKIHSFVNIALERAQASNSIQLDNMYLQPQTTEPIFKAILHQANLRELDLHNNAIENEGCRQLAKSLGTLKQLKTLKLRGNFITADGVEVLFQSAAAIENLTELEELELSQNPIGNASVRTLHKLMTSCKTIRKLHLAECGLTQLYDYDLGYGELNEFDISFNHLEDDAFYRLLTKLNASRLQLLNVSYTTMLHDETSPASQTYVDRLAEFFESGPCEQFKRLYMAGCHLTDDSVQRIAQCLRNANDLEVLNIGDNGKLTGAALQYIIDDVGQLRKLLAHNCRRLIDGQRIEKMIVQKPARLPIFMKITVAATTTSNNDNLMELISNLRILWQSQWGDKGNVKSDARGNVALYVNVKDLLSY